MTKRVLIAPLDWGMGHTTRMIALAECLEEQGAKVIFALPLNQQKLLNEYGFECVIVPGYDIKYYTIFSPTLSLILQSPKILFKFFQEKYRATKLARSLNIDIIISDNRPFFRSKHALSAYVTHQVNIQQKGIAGQIIQKTHRFLIGKFDCCLIPDSTNNQFAGALSNAALLKSPSIFVGPLSRFRSSVNREVQEKTNFTLAVIASGPTPWRDLFIQSVIDELSTMEGNFVVIGALPTNKTNKKRAQVGNITLTGHLPTAQFYEILASSKTIFSLAGYTTIMDMAIIGKPLIMMATPNQGEQEYLVQHLRQQPGYYPINNIAEIRNVVNKTMQPPISVDLGILEQSCVSLLQMAKKTKN